MRILRRLESTNWTTAANICHTLKKSKKEKNPSFSFPSVNILNSVIFSVYMFKQWHHTVIRYKYSRVALTCALLHSPQHHNKTWPTSLSSRFSPCLSAGSVCTAHRTRSCTSRYRLKGKDSIPSVVQCLLLSLMKDTVNPVLRSPYSTDLTQDIVVCCINQGPCSARHSKWFLHAVLYCISLHCVCAN